MRIQKVFIINQIKVDDEFNNIELKDSNLLDFDFLQNKNRKNLFQTKFSFSSKIFVLSNIKTSRKIFM